MEISYSRLRVYLECPYKYKLVFVDGKRVPLTPSSSLGLSLHRALECFHRKDAGSLEDLLDCYDDRWLGAGYPDEETKELWNLKGRRILERYHVAEQDRRSEILGVEREFIYPLGRHTVRGMVDRIDRLPDGRYEVIDYKTHLDLKTEEQAADDLQLRFYALGVEESLAIEASLVTLHYVAAGKKVSIPYEGKGEEELRALIERSADLIEAGDFRPNTSFCPSCDFRLTCPHSTRRG